MIPEDPRFLLGRGTFLRYSIQTFCILKTNLHLYLVLTFELSHNSPPVRLVTDHYIVYLQVVSNVPNEDFLVSIFEEISLSPKHFLQRKFNGVGESINNMNVSDSPSTLWQSLLADL